jgi:hypothetical protein
MRAEPTAMRSSLATPKDIAERATWSMK